MIIGVVGLLDSGKGTVGNILREIHGFVPEAFANPVKDCCSTIFGWPRHLLEGDTKISREFRETKDEYWSEKLGYDVTPRLMMQKLGTEGVRQGIHDEIWLHSLANRISDTHDTFHYVITDVRFPNEITWVWDNHGYVINTIRGEYPDWAKSLLNFQNGCHSTQEQRRKLMNVYHPQIHESEWAHIGHFVDYTIHNDFDIAHLEKEVYNILQVIIGA